MTFKENRFDDDNTNDDGPTDSVLDEYDSNN